MNRRSIVAWSGVGCGVNLGGVVTGLGVIGRSSCGVVNCSRIGVVDWLNIRRNCGVDRRRVLATRGISNCGSIGLSRVVSVVNDNSCSVRGNSRV